MSQTSILPKAGRSHDRHHRAVLIAVNASKCCDVLFNSSLHLKNKKILFVLLGHKVQNVSI